MARKEESGSRHAMKREKQNKFKNKTSSIKDGEYMTIVEKGLLPNSLFDSVAYYSKSESNNIKVGKYSVRKQILSKHKLFEITCNVYNASVNKKGLINRQIILFFDNRFTYLG